MKIKIGMPTQTSIYQITNPEEVWSLIHWMMQKKYTMSSEGLLVSVFELNTLTHAKKQRGSLLGGLFVRKKGSDVKTIGISKLKSHVKRQELVARPL